MKTAAPRQTLRRRSNLGGVVAPSLWAIFAASALLAGAAHAGSGETAILERSCGFLVQIQKWIFGAAYVLGAIGLVLVAVSAFLGRFKFAHLIALGGGLFIVAMADLLIGFATDGEASGACVS